VKVAVAIFSILFPFVMLLLPETSPSLSPSTTSEGSVSSACEGAAGIMSEGESKPEIARPKRSRSKSTSKSISKVNTGGPRATITNSSSGISNDATQTTTENLPKRQAPESKSGSSVSYDMALLLFILALPEFALVSQSSTALSLLVMDHLKQVMQVALACAQTQSTWSMHSTHTLALACTHTKCEVKRSNHTPLAQGGGEN
jgi:hypothetical protein